jgi:hypothetical protein
MRAAGGSAADHRIPMGEAGVVGDIVRSELDPIFSGGRDELSGGRRGFVRQPHAKPDIACAHALSLNPPTTRAWSVRPCNRMIRGRSGHSRLEDYRGTGFLVLEQAS